MSSFEEKYLKALRSIEEILKANRQIKEELDALRTMRQAEIDSYTTIQNEEFRKAYESLLQDKNAVAIRNQTLELENQRLKYALAEAEQQLATLKQPAVVDATAKPESRQAELRRTIENCEEHQATLQRNCRRLEERNSQLEGKLVACEKMWRGKLEAKDLEVVEVKARARQEFGDQVTVLRKENASLRLASSEATAKLENCQQGVLFGQQLQALDWEGDLLRELTAVRTSLEPLRQQVVDLQETDHFQRESVVRERAALQARVMELQADGQRQNEVIRSLEQRLVEGEQSRREGSTLAQQVRRLEEENQLLSGRIIVMESREVVLRTRTGEQLEQRVLQFENRIDLLLANKEGLRELREVGIHQLIALKAYILQLDSRLKELLLSNGYLLKKYKGYKEKYQASLREQKQHGLTVNTLRTKIMGYDQLVLKLQAELEAALRAEPARERVADNSQEDLYRRKYDLLQEKFEVQEKYKNQELDTFRLNYETRIVELTIKAEEAKSLRETIELYRSKNEELQGLLARRENEITESRVLTQSKVGNEPEMSRQARDMIASLHATLKAHDDTIFRLQAQIRNKEEAHRRAVRKLEKEIEDATDHHSRDLARKELDFSLTLDQEVKKYKLRVAELEHAHQYATPAREEGETEGRLRILQKQLETAESSREEEIFNRRRLEKQLLDLTHDHEELQRHNNELELKLGQLRTLQRDYEDMKGRTTMKEPSGGHWDYQLQSKDAIIKRLSNQLQELKQSLAVKPPGVPASQKNEVYYLKKEIEELKSTIARQGRESTSFSTAIEGSKAKLNSDLQAALQEKEALIVRLRRDLSLKENKVLEFEEDAGKLTEQIRRFKRELTEIDRLRHETARLEAVVLEKDRLLQQLRSEGSSYDVELDRIRQQLVFVKENYQRLTYESLQKSDQISRLTLEVNAAGSRNNSLLEARHAEELAEQERQYRQLTYDLAALKSTLSTAEQDRQFHEENYRRASNDILGLRQENGQLREQNDDLREQLSSINRQVIQMRTSLEAYRGQSLQRREREEENYLIKTEFFALKSDISNLNEEIFSKEAAIARLNNQLSLLKAHTAELEEELYATRQQSSKIAFEYNTLRDQHLEASNALQERDDAFQRINVEVATLRREKRELSEQLQYMSSTFATLSQELAKTKTNLAYYEDEIEAKGKDTNRLTVQMQNLRAEVVNLQQIASDKQVEINKLRQELLAVRFEASERDYDQKLRADREIYAYRAKIASLERDLDERQHEIRRLEKQNRPESPTFDFEAQELRIELEKTQRELLIAKSENERLWEEQQNLVVNVNSLRRVVMEREEQLREQRQSVEKWKLQANRRQGRSREEIETLTVEILSYRQRLAASENLQLQLSANKAELKGKSEQISRLKDQLNRNNEQLNRSNDQLNRSNDQALQLQQQLRLSQEEIAKLHHQFEQRTSQIRESVAQQHNQIIGQLQANCQEFEVQVKNYQRQVLQYEHRIQQNQHRVQYYEHRIHEYEQRIQYDEHKTQEYVHTIQQNERRIQQYENRIKQYGHRIAYLSQQSQQLIKAQHNYQASIQELRFRHSQETSHLHSQLRQQATMTALATSSHSIGVSPAEDHSHLVHPYLEEIDRLNSIIRQLEQDLAAFKLKLFSMIGHQNRIEQNLSAMVKIFNEVVSVRQSIEVREAEIGEVRRSFLQKADSESGRSSRALAQSGHGSLQGSQVQERQQPRGGLVSIKISSSGEHDPRQSHPQSFVQPIRLVQQPLIAQLPAAGGPPGQIGGELVRLGNYFTPLGGEAGLYRRQ